METSRQCALLVILILFFSSTIFVVARSKKRIDWSKIDNVLKDSIANRIFPGCAVAVGGIDGIMYTNSVGFFTYDSGAPPVTNESLFDMASLTKVTMTTTAIAQFYQRGEISMNQKVSSIFPDFAVFGKETITIENLLLHNSGLAPDPIPNFEKQSFGCPESFKQHPEQNFSCMEKIFNGVMNQKLQNPVGQVYKYSDLSMITLMYVIGKFAKKLNHVQDSDVWPDCPLNQRGSEQCYYEAYIRKFIFEPLAMKNSLFKPTPAMKERCLPSWNETLLYRHEIIQGYVSDENAYAMGGIAGHAGLFTTITDITKLLHDLMFGHKLVNETTMKFFTSVKNHTQSARALGWDTNFNQDTNGTCQKLSKNTYMHTGFSGTSICADPDKKVYVILLTNSKYPDKSNTQVQSVRNKVSSIVSELL